MRLSKAQAQVVKDEAAAEVAYQAESAGQADPTAVEVKLDRLIAAVDEAIAALRSTRDQFARMRQE